MSDPIVCSFCDCRHTDPDCRVMITRNSVAICDACIAECVRTAIADLHEKTKIVTVLNAPAPKGGGE